MNSVSRIAILSLLALSCQSSFSLAQDKSGDANALAKLPSAKSVIEKHILARGGYELLSSITTMHTVWEKQENGKTWKFERWRLPNQKYSVKLVDGMLDRTAGTWVADSSRGANKLRGISWYQRPGNPAVEISGQSLTEHLTSTAQVERAASWIATCKSVSCDAIENVNDRPCYRLNFLESNNTVTSRFFDIETGFLLKRIKTEFYTGESVVTRVYSDHQPSDGLVIPRTETIDSESGHQVWRIVEVEHSIEIDSNTFEIPPQIMASIDILAAKVADVTKKNSAK